MERNDHIKKIEQAAELYQTAEDVGKVGTAVVGAGAAAGAVAGLSGGASVMSGLAAAGSVVGGGAVAGLGSLAAGPAVVAKMAMDQVLKDDESLPDNEREARTVGRTMTTVGALAGGAVTVGTLTGASAAGITSGLAAIGGTVGGGMLIGVGMTIAAPAVAATALGYGAYKVWKWLSD
jgi:hypothetical protein